MTKSFWSYACASAIGTSHAKSGRPCQDYGLSRVLMDAEGREVLVLLVCDGAGSAAHSDVGSSLAAGWFAERVQDHFENGGRLDDIDRGLMLHWLTELSHALYRHAEEFGRRPRDYSCTMLIALVGSASAVFAQVGDGAIVVSQGDEEGWSYIFWPQHGEFANSTNFLQNENLPEVLDFCTEPRPIDQVAVFSDGIENLVLQQSRKEVHDPFFDTMFLPLRACNNGFQEKLSADLARYLDSRAICEKTDDDKTLVMATRCKIPA